MMEHKKNDNCYKVICHDNDKRITRYNIDTDYGVTGKGRVKQDRKEGYEECYSDNCIKRIQIKETKYKKYVEIDVYKPQVNICSVMNYIFSLDDAMYKYVSTNEKSIFDFARDIRNRSKELSESGGVLKFLHNAANGTIASMYSKNKIPVTDDTLHINENVIAYMIADGMHGLTGYLAYISTKWKKIISFDPIVKEEKRYGDRFYIKNKLDSEVELVDKFDDKTLIIVIGVHTHCDTDKFINRLKEKYKGCKLLLCLLPCCFLDRVIPQKLTATLIHRELGIMSNKNLIYLYETIL